MALGDVLEIDDRTRLIVGQELKMAVRQPDVGNVIVHRTGDLLVLVDSGLTQTVRDAIRAAADALRPWSKVLLITTHAHPDHVGNNDVVGDFGLAPEDVRHYVSAYDVGQYRDHGHDYWETTLARIAGLVPGFDDPVAAADRLLGLFTPLTPVTGFTRTFEELPLEHIVLGPVHLAGWTFGDGAVHVIRTRGHCAGHVVVHLRDARLLHLSDETNGPCGALHDANQQNIFTALGQALTLVETGVVDKITEGHAFEVFGAAAAAERLRRTLRLAAALDAAAQELIGSGPIELGHFTDQFIRRAQELGVAGANPNPMFFTMMAVSKLRDLHLVPADDGTGQSSRRPLLRT